MQQTYLVTGAAGFIAARTAQKLLDAGHCVVGLDNLNDYYDPRLKEHRLRLLENSPAFQFYAADIEDRAALESVFSHHRFDAVLNLAARAGVRQSLENPFVYMTTNAIGTLNLLEAARRAGTRKFVLASTSSLYAGQPAPFVETLPVNTPVSPYAASKKSAEMTAHVYHKLYEMDVSILRYFTVFGPAGRPDMSVFSFAKAIAEGTPLVVNGDGTQTRDFTYVDDIADGTIAALAPLGYEIINLGGGNCPLALNELISQMETLLGKKALRVAAPFHKADMETTAADISKARRVLHWEPQFSVQEGLRRTVAWHLENAELVRTCVR
ncbi:MAG: SDR family NAD(P)-dependent oxidoreductase [Puniceicoccales bacterium]|jgi:nucleoside-diphosphate-sugar epimerase|nr:SDR family NAD(P)-dependent oxidoreductase [Puniceicoccales bacterium]